jgi:hypothetical protein
MTRTADEVHCAAQAPLAFDLSGLIGLISTWH